MRGRVECAVALTVILRLERRPDSPIVHHCRGFLGTGSGLAAVRLDGCHLVGGVGAGDFGSTEFILSSAAQIGGVSCPICEGHTSRQENSTGTRCKYDSTLCRHLQKPYTHPCDGELMQVGVGGFGETGDLIWR